MTRHYRESKVKKAAEVMERSFSRKSKAEDERKTLELWRDIFRREAVLGCSLEELFPEEYRRHLYRDHEKKNAPRSFRQEELMDIRAKYVGGMSMAAIAMEYGVSINKIFVTLGRRRRVIACRTFREQNIELLGGPKT